jgi:hypothetical protein
MKKNGMPGIPPAGPGIDPRTQAVLRPLKEIIEIREGLRGDPLERAVTLGDLVRLGLITEQQAGNIGV